MTFWSTLSRLAFLLGLENVNASDDEEELVRSGVAKIAVAVTTVQVCLSESAVQSSCISDSSEGPMGKLS